MTDFGIDKKLSFRHLFIIRNSPMPAGAVTAQTSAINFKHDGGRIVALGDDDLRSFVALREMRAAKIDGFDALAARAQARLCRRRRLQIPGNIFQKALAECGGR